MAVSSKTPLLRVQDIRKTYGEELILHDVSFEVAAGDILGIIGPNGAGKSTLAKIILGFDSDYSGVVTVQDNVRTAYVPQFSTTDAYSLPLSVYEFLRSAANIYYGLEHTANKSAMVETLSHVDLGESYLEHNFYTLSGGERQRVLIARALLSNPDLIVLDEPLASVDYGARGALHDLLQHLNKEHGFTIILISHDVQDVVAISDSTLCLNKTLFHGCHPADFARNGGHANVVDHQCHT